MLVHRSAMLTVLICALALAPGSTPAAPPPAAGGPLPSRITASRPPVRVAPPQIIALPGHGYLIDSVQNPARPNEVYGLAYSNEAAYVVESRDSGATFTIAFTLPTQPTKDTIDYYNRIAVSPSGTDVCFTTQQKIHCSSAGLQDFRLMFDGAAAFPSQARLRHIAFSPDGKRFAAAGSVDGLVLFARGPGGAFVRQAVNGFMRDIGPYEDRAPFVSQNGNLSLAFDPWNPSVIYVGNGNLAVRYDVAGRWRLLDQGGTMYHDSTVYSILTQADGNLLVSTCNGMFVGQARAGAGATGAIRWGRIGSGGFMRGNFMDLGTGVMKDPTAIVPSFMRGYRLAERAGHPSDLVMASASGVYVSRDSGVTWARLAGIPDREPGKPFMLMHEYYAATWLSDGTLLVSLDIATSIRDAKRMTLRLQLP